MSQRLSRQEIKRDEVLEGLSRSIEFSRHHARAIGLAALAALLVVLAALGAGWWMKQRGERANHALSEVLGSEAGVADRQSLEEVAARYGSSAPGSVALALAGEAAAAEGDLAAAREHWEAFLDRAPQSMLSVNVRLNLIGLARQQGRAEEVERELRAMLEAPDPALPVSLARYQLGLTLETLGRPDEARAAYDQVLEEAPDSPVARAARERQAALVEG
jgi:tetratricopeptide (TPR) repeat protein